MLRIAQQTNKEACHMALIQLGPLASQVSGSIGGTVFSHNRGGSYIRSRVVPVKVENQYTLEVRDALSQCSRLWGGLSEEERQAWRQFSTDTPVINKIGMSKTLSGHMAFNKVNSRLLLQGVAPVDLPPSVNPPNALTTFSLDLDATAGTAEVTFTTTPVGAGKALWIWGALPAGPGARYVANKWRLFYRGGPAVATGVDVWDSIVARWGAIQPGQVMALQAQILSTTSGLVSAMLPYIAVAV